MGSGRGSWAALVGVSVVLGACSHKEAGPPQFAELMPVAMMQAAAPPPPVAAEPAKPPPEPPKPAGPVYGGHLASYYREAQAVSGWNIIVRQQSSIGSLKRHIVPIQTAKGAMVRLIAGDFPTQDEAARFCTWAKQQHLYCAVMQMGPNDTSSTALPATSPRPARRVRRRPASG